MRQPKISIITPSYNQGQFIEQTITSVLDQGYPNLEYLIIDGGSTDNTVEIIKKYEKYLAYWVSEKDKGQSDAINKGMKLVSGEIVNWLNSDDYYMPGALHHVGEQFTSPQVTAYCGRSRVFSDHHEQLSQGTDVYANNLAKTVGWARIDQPETFFRKLVWDKIGLLNESFHYVMDKEWWVRYLLHFGLAGIAQDEKVVVNFRIHGASKTGSQLAKFHQETFDLFYSLAQSIDVPTSQKFSSLTACTTKDIFGYSNADRLVLEKAIHYFFLYITLEAYAQNDYTLAKKAAKMIGVHQINKDDHKKLKDVLLRMQLLPIGAKKLLNKIRNKLD